MRAVSGAAMLWRLAGLLCVLVGAAGIVLPLLPGTPFLLLGAYCFAQSSQRLHDWLVEHDWLGPPIRDWQRNRSISRSAKQLASLMLVATPVVTYLLEAPAWVISAQIVVLGVVAGWIWTRPEP